LVHLPSTIKQPIAAGLMVAILLLSSCDEVGRHKTLTFFFDGVPPLRSAVSESAASVAKGPKASPSTPATNWHVHEPVKDCTVCHGNQPRRGTSPKVQLVARVPQLCYQCHPGPAALEGWVHGPVATGDCLLCHEPHRTKAESLLRKPIPELCFQCHEPRAVHAIQGHAEPSYEHCVDCHEGHAGAKKSLLKPAFLEAPAGQFQK
jgi:predicted CXXCH cytochrome family protein